MAKINFVLIISIFLILIMIRKLNARQSLTTKAKGPQQTTPKGPTQTVAATSGGEKHHLQIFYEALCPESERFMAQLEPIYDALKEYLQMEFIPYGLTKLLCRNIIAGSCEHPTFTCRHGPPGCHANRLHDCALQYSESQDKQMNFITCTMGAYKSPIDKCLNLLGFSIYDVDTCMTFEEGTELQLRSYEKTNNLKPQELPIVIFDNVYSQETQAAALKDFRVLICSMMANKYQHFNQTNAPEICLTNDVFPNI